MSDEKLLGNTDHINVTTHDITWVYFLLPVMDTMRVLDDEICCRYKKSVKVGGTYKQKGKTYLVRDGDGIFFKFNVSGGGKK